jgi:hypothetical protein
MLDFATTDLSLRTAHAERNREASQIASKAELHREIPVGLRAALAVRIARLALAVDHDAAGSVVHRHAHIAGRW